MQFKFNRILYFGIVVCLVIMTAGIGSADEVNLELVGQSNTTGYMHIAVSENYAYAADGSNGLVILDINNPVSPLLIGNYDTGGNAVNVDISGNYAYVANGDSGLKILDISNPYVPTLKGGYDTGNSTWEVAVAGNCAYLTDWYNGLSIVDISNSSSPVLIGVYNTTPRSWDVAVEGNYAYLSHDYGNFTILSIKNASSPELKGSYDTYAHEIAVKGNYAYLFGENLSIIDITDPSSPILVGNYEVYRDHYNAPYGIDIKECVTSGNYVYLLYTKNNIEDCLEVVNVTTPSSPAFAGSYYTDNDNILFDVDVKGNYIYLADSHTGLRILRSDIQNQDTAPELSPIGNKIVNETELLSFTVSATDSDGDAITYSVTGLPSGATFDSITKTFCWTPGTGTEGVYNTTFTATAGGKSDSETITITVSDWNPWNDPDSQNGTLINLFELQTAIYDWRFGVTLPTGELIDLSRLQSLIYQWRFG